ncbi:MAG: type II secretion system F family protein, partial [Dehalococcoidia bacterium]|nr:type II secretion system F family protein [Dehalococcoidia bacterium]
RDEGAKQPAGSTLKRPRSSIPTLGRLLSSSAWADSMAFQLQQANVQLRVGEYLLARLVLAAAVLFVVAALTRLHPLGIIFGLAGGAVGFWLPAIYLTLLRQRRLAKIERQLVDFAPSVASSLRSGFALQQGIELAARQLDSPMRDELAYLINDINLGSTTEAALLDLGKRVGSTDVDMLVTAILVQRSSGGNLSEVLDQAAETLRERERIRGDLQTLTAQQRLTGIILSVYPMAIGLLLLALMPDLWSVLFTETLGRIVLGIGLGLQLLGFLVMRRVMNIDI